MCGASPTPRGSVNRSGVRHVHQHELDTAERLARHGHHVRFIAPLEDDRAPDVEIDGVRWELKSPVAHGPRTVVEALRSARDQSRLVVVDLSRTDMAASEAERQISVFFARYSYVDEVKTLEREGRITTPRR